MTKDYSGLSDSLIVRLDVVGVAPLSAFALTTKLKALANIIYFLAPLKTLQLSSPATAGILNLL